MKTNQIITSTKTLALAIILATGVSYIFAWTGPGTGVTPPNGNVAAPLNVSTSTQTKIGPLVVNYGNTAGPGLEVLGGIQIVDGTQGAGKILTSDANGVASWATSTVAGAGAAYYTTHGSYTWTAPVGATQVTVQAWGAGGGSGGNLGGPCGYYGQAGAGGGYTQAVVPVTPGTQYTVIVGAGGAGGINGNTPGCNGAASNGGNGGVSSFGGTLVVANGGTGGIGGRGGNSNYNQGCPNCTAQGGTGSVSSAVTSWFTVPGHSTFYGAPEKTGTSVSGGDLGYVNGAPSGWNGNASLFGTDTAGAFPGGGAPTSTTTPLSSGQVVGNGYNGADGVVMITF